MSIKHFSPSRPSRDPHYFFPQIWTTFQNYCQLTMKTLTYWELNFSLWFCFSVFTFYRNAPASCTYHIFFASLSGLTFLKNCHQLGEGTLPWAIYRFWIFSNYFSQKFEKTKITVWWLNCIWKFSFRLVLILLHIKSASEKI